MVRADTRPISSFLVVLTGQCLTRYIPQNPHENIKWLTRQRKVFSLEADVQSPACKGSETHVVDAVHIT